MLYDIAELTNSSFNFIPDASMVGTTFCNYLANILSPNFNTTNVKIINDPNDLINLDENIQLTNYNNLEPDEQYELIRYHVYQILKQICELSPGKTIGQNMITIVNAFKLFITNTQMHSQSNLLKNLIKDFVSSEQDQEQITKALSRPEWFNKWGYHYLLSLSSAHLIRQCHNYKDQGVQLYGNSMFQTLQNEVYEIFSKIQPPKPSRRAEVIRTNMSTYVDRSGGCFSPESKVKLSDGTCKKLIDLDGSEQIYQSDTLKSVGIKYIVKTKISTENNLVSVCKINNLTITEYHPIHDIESNIWVFPNTIVSPQLESFDYVYNLVLESGYYAIIDDFKCVTMGHNLSEFDFNNKILAHDFYGTNKVIDAIEQFKLSESKIITLDNYNIQRDPLTTLVCGLIKI